MKVINEVKVGDRFKYTPQVTHSPSEERIYRVIKVYKHPRYGDTRYEVVDEETGEKRRGFVMSNFQVPAITRLKRNPPPL